MTTLAIVLSATPLVAGACWWMARQHSHPEYVRRDELALLRELMRQNHESVLRELEQLRALVDRHSRR